MIKTPDHRTAKRDRTPSPEVPSSRMRVLSPSSPSDDVVVSGWQSDNVVSLGGQEDKDEEHSEGVDEYELDEHLLLSESYLESTRRIIDEEALRSDWADIMEQEERKENLSALFLRLNEEDEQWDCEEGEIFESVNRDKNNKPQQKFLDFVTASIKAAVSEAVNPLRQEIAELKLLLLKGQISTPASFSEPPTNPPVWPTVASATICSNYLPDKPHLSEREEAFALAKKCIGLWPVAANTLDNHVNQCNPSLDPVSRAQTGGAYTARDYLCKVLQMPEHEASDLRITRTFTLPGNSHLDTLYVEFLSQQELTAVRSYSKNMTTKGNNIPKLITFIPKVLQSSYDDICMRANIGRAQTPRQSSKIWVGHNSFELRLKVKGDKTPWGMIAPQQPILPNPGAKPQPNPQPFKEPSLSQRLVQPNPSTDIRTNAHNIIPVSDPLNSNYQPVGQRRKTTTQVGPKLLLRLPSQPISTANSFQPLINQPCP